MNEIYAIALSWAVTLTGYPMPDRAPEVVSVPHSFLVQQACGGRECKVLGWFPPGEKIYLDNRLNPAEDLYANSILVHEMVHYLQHTAHKASDSFSCKHAVELEHEAYGAQGAFLTRYGVYRPVGLSMNSVSCGLAAEGK
jgi:hypothetical protein